MIHIYKLDHLQLDNGVWLRWLCMIDLMLFVAWLLAFALF